MTVCARVRHYFMQSCPFNAVRLLSELQGRPAEQSEALCFGCCLLFCCSCKNNYGSENIFKNVV